MTRDLLSAPTGRRRMACGLNVRLRGCEGVTTYLTACRPGLRQCWDGLIRVGQLRHRVWEVTTGAG